MLDIKNDNERKKNATIKRKDKRNKIIFNLQKFIEQ
jgi:hypothetical protein